MSGKMYDKEHMKNRYVAALREFSVIDEVIFWELHEIMHYWLFGKRDANDE